MSGQSLGASRPVSEKRPTLSVVESGVVEMKVSLPHSYEAEQGLLGAILVNNGALDRVRDHIVEEDFADPVHGRIYVAAKKLIDRGQIANPVTLKAMFDQDNALAEVRGAEYLVKLAASVVAIINAEDYGLTIADYSLRRRQIVAQLESIGDAATIDVDRSGAQTLDDAEARLNATRQGGAVRKGELVPVSVALRRAVEQTEAAYKVGGVVGCPTGLTAVDHFLGGLRRGRVYIAAARTGMGKSDFAGNVGVSVARKQAELPEEERGAVAFFSLEMPADELGERILAQITGIPATRQGRGDVSAEELVKLDKAARELESLPLLIDDTPASTVATIASRARGLKRKHGLALIIIDYVQLIAPGNSRSNRNTTRVDDVSAITAALKELAKTLDVPILALAQVSRKAEERDDKRPRLPDLRESGSIEQDADVVMFLFREEYYLAREEPKQRTGEKMEAFAGRQADHAARMAEVKGVLEVIIDKHRGGAKGTAKLFYAPARSFIGDLFKDDAPAPDTQAAAQLEAPF